MPNDVSDMVSNRIRRALEQVPRLADALESGELRKANAPGFALYIAGVTAKPDQIKDGDLGGLLDLLSGLPIPNSPPGVLVLEQRDRMVFIGYAFAGKDVLYLKDDHTPGITSRRELNQMYPNAFPSMYCARRQPLGENCFSSEFTSRSQGTRWPRGW